MRYFFLLLIPIISMSAYSQNSKITLGVVNYSQNEYEKAYENLVKAFAEEDQIDSKYLSKGRYYLGLTIYRLYFQRVDADGFDALHKIGITPLQAFNNMETARILDEKKWGKKVKDQYLYVKQGLLQVALFTLNNSYTQSKKADHYLNISQENSSAYLSIDQSNYTVYDIRGQALLIRKDSAKALFSFERSRDLFLTQLPEKPDLLIAYTFYRIALINRYRSNNLEKAMSNVDNGLLQLENEWQRVIALEDEELTHTLNPQYLDAKRDLEMFYLDILVNMPFKKEEAISKLKKAIQDYPDNVSLYLIYAGLLESTDMEKAKEIYLKAIELDPENPKVYYNLGALLTNKAVEYFALANEEPDFGKSTEYMEMAKKYLLEAQPYFEISLKQNPDDLSVISALMQIYLNTGNLEDYEKMKGLKQSQTD